MRAPATKELIIDASGIQPSSADAGALDIGRIGRDEVIGGSDVDVARMRERTRQARFRRLALLLSPLALLLWMRLATGNPIQLGVPSLPDGAGTYMPGLLLVLMLFCVLVIPMLLAGRSPGVRYQPSEIDVALDDVVGLDTVKDEVVKTLNLFLAYRTFRDRMGGSPRKAILFEGPPGTGKTYMAKAMAREAGVPFFFVSASSFQSMYYGQTNRKIRSFFRELRKAAREEGGSIGFIEEIDAIAGARANMRKASPVDADDVARGVAHSNMSEGIAGIVNELLVQLQSFEQPTFGGRVKGVFIDLANQWLPRERRLEKQPPGSPNVLVIGATNRAADLDPALLRPGRFDRSLHFDLPGRSGRREIIDYYLDRKAHVPDLDRGARRDQLAAMTYGYSPVMIEHLFDEGLVWALRSGRESMDWTDINQAKMTEEIGLKQPVEYSDIERRTIATHEAGHAVTAHLVGHDRKLEVLSIIKRRESLGLLAHSDTEERFTRTRSELISAIQISFGGMVAEELFFGEAGTGPSSDLAHATKVACQMVGSFGMAGSLVSYEAVEASVVSQGIVGKVLGNEDGRRAVDRLLDQAKSDVRSLLDEHRYLVEALRNALLEREELVGDEILSTLEAAEEMRALHP